MSKLNLVGVIAILAFLSGVHVACAEEKPPDWKRVTRLHRGERIALTTAQGEQPAVFVSADASSLLIADLVEVPQESSRKAIAAAVREAPSAPVGGELLVKGLTVAIVRVQREQVQQVTRVSERGSAGVTAAATAAAAVAGIYLGALAGVAVDGGVLAEDRGGSVAFFAVAIAVPAAIGLAVHSATKRPFTEVLYAASPAAPLGDADWQAVEKALPPSLRHAARRP